MEILLVNIFSIIVQTIATSYLVLFIVPTITKNEFSKKQMIAFTCIIFLGLCCGTILKNILPGSNTLFIITIEFILLVFLLKLKPLKSILIIIVHFSILAITEIISVYLTMFIFKTTMEDLLLSPLKLFSVNLLQILIICLIYFLYFKIAKKRPANFDFFNKINNKQIVIITILLVTYIFPQMLLFITNSYTYPLSLLVINSLQFILIAIIIFKFVKNSVDYEKSQSDLFLSNLHNKTLVSMVDGVRTLKHDYSNIIQALNGYVVTKQYDELEEYINTLLKEFNVVNNLSLIDPVVFNEPAIYGVVGSKYFLSNKKNIPFDLNVSIDISKISFPKPELSRILGILLDNAIEATQKSKKPYISLKFYFDKKKCADIIKVSNSYDTNIEIDFVNLFKKGYSTKEIKSGIGLWEVKKIIDKNHNSQIVSAIEKKKFTQTLIIEKIEEYN